MTIVPIGKIANIESIEIVEAKETEKAEGFLESIGIYLGIGYLVFVIFLFASAGAIAFFERRKKMRNVDEFISKHDDLTEPQKEIVVIYLKRWNRGLDRLVRNIIEGDDAVDMESYLNKEILRFGKIVAVLIIVPLIKRLHFITLPIQIFHREGLTVSLNQDNKEFIEKFFKEV